MREILFRGIRKDTHELVYGFYGEYFNGKKNISCISVVDTHAIAGTFCYEVIPETVSQFTGLYDKNGVRIWENDIVRYNDLAFNPNIGRFENMIFTSAVTYNLDNGCFSPFEPDTFESYIRAENVEVIGNRFDNPDLLN